MSRLSASDLCAAVLDYLAGDGTDTHFTAVARLVFTYQYENNPPYRRFCEGRGIAPDHIDRWQDIPPAPVAAFKRFTLSCTPLEDCTPERGGRTFHSSGTTGAETSRHYMDAAALTAYRRTLHRAYREYVLADGASLPVLALMPSPMEAPHSSLSFMLDELMPAYGGRFFWGERVTGQFASALTVLTEPVVVFSTAFALINFFDRTPEDYPLPPGSRIVETGGFKGRSREVSREELYSLCVERFVVPATHCLSEYGMSELASQYYDTTLRAAVQGVVPDGVSPPLKAGATTLRTRILDPITGEEAAPNQAGLLAHYDLCNINSMIGIQTEDMGVWNEDRTGFTLLGRAPGAVLRGCSLTAEDRFFP